MFLGARAEWGSSLNLEHAQRENSDAATCRKWLVLSSFYNFGCQEKLLLKFSCRLQYGFYMWVVWRGCRSAIKNLDTPSSVHVCTYNVHSSGAPTMTCDKSVAARLMLGSCTPEPRATARNLTPESMNLGRGFGTQTLLYPKTESKQSQGVSRRLRSGRSTRSPAPYTVAVEQAISRRDTCSTHTTQETHGKRDGPNQTRRPFAAHFQKWWRFVLVL